MYARIVNSQLQPGKREEWIAILRDSIMPAPKQQPGFQGFVVLAKRGITVNAISPGWTEDSVLNSLPEVVQTLQRNWHGTGWTPMGRLGTPADIGNVAALRCSPEASWSTGQVIYADGGASLMNAEVAPEIQLG